MNEVGNSIVILVVGVLMVALLTGCSGSTGWNVGFHATPVTSVDYNQKLEPKVRLVRK